MPSYQYKSIPLFYPPGATFLTGQPVKIMASNNVAELKITFDGSEPSVSHYSVSGNSYSFNLSEEKELTVKAVAVLDGVVSEVYSQQYKTVAVPDDGEKTAWLYTPNFNYSTSIAVNSANFFVIATQKDKPYILDTCDQNNTATDTALQIYDASQDPVKLMAEDNYGSYLEADMNTSHLVFKSSEDATYAVLVTEESGLAVPQYYIRLFDTSDALQIVPDSVYYSKELKPCDRQFYYFTAKAGKEYVIYTYYKKTEVSTDTLLVLYNSDLSDIKTMNDDQDNEYRISDCDNCSLVRLEAQQQDTVFYMMVKPKYETRTGSYQVHVHEVREGE